MTLSHSRLVSRHSRVFVNHLKARNGIRDESDRLCAVLCGGERLGNEDTARQHLHIHFHSSPRSQTYGESD